LRILAAAFSSSIAIEASAVAMCFSTKHVGRDDGD
jgi:hypothetical protein